MKYESKITGLNPLGISALLTGAFLIVCATGGDNVSWEYLGSEVIFPFYMAIAAGEWCKIQTDPMFDVISAQGRSLFPWIVRRYLFLSGTTGIFALLGMLAISAIKQGSPVTEMICLFLPTAFVLSSAGVFISLLCNIPHIPAMTIGVAWLFSIMAKGLLRFAPVPYFYLFIRYAGIDDGRFKVNKMILLFTGALMWSVVYVLCKKRIWVR